MVKKWTVLLLTLFIGTSLSPAASSRWSGLARPLARWFSTNPTPPAPPIRPDVSVPDRPDNHPTAPQPDYAPVRRTQAIGTRLRPVTEIIAESRRRQGLPERTSIIVPEVEYNPTIDIDKIDFSAIDPDVLNQVITPSAVSGTRRWLDRDEQDVSSFGGSYISPKEYEALRKNFASAQEGRSQGLFDILPEEEKIIEKAETEPTPVAHSNANENLSDYNVPFSMFGDDDNPIEIERPLNQPRRPLLSEREPTALRVREAAQVMPYEEQRNALAPLDSSAVEQFHYRPEVISPSTEISGELNAPRTVLDATQGSDGVWRYNPTGQTEAHTPAIQPTSKIIPYTSPSTELAPVDSSAVEQFHYRPEVLSPSTEISGELNAPRTVLDATQGSDGVWRYNPTGQTEAHTPAIQPTSKIIPYTSPSTELAPVDSSAVEQFHYRPEVLSPSTEITGELNAPRTVLDATLETDGVWRYNPSGQPPEQPTAYTSGRELVPMHTQANLVPAQQRDPIVITLDKNEFTSLLQQAMGANTTYTHGRATTADMADFLITYLGTIPDQSSAIIPYKSKQKALTPFNEKDNALIPTKRNLIINKDALIKLLDTALDADALHPGGRRTPEEAAQILAPEFEAVLTQLYKQTAATPPVHQQDASLKINTSNQPQQLALPAPEVKEPSLWDQAKELGERVKNLALNDNVQKVATASAAGAASAHSRTGRIARKLAQQGNRMFTVARQQPVVRRTVNARVRVTHKPQPVVRRTVDAPVKITYKPQPVVRRTVDARARVTPRNQIVPRPGEQNSFNSQAARSRSIVDPVISKNRIRGRIIDLTQSKDNVWRAPKPERPNVQPGTVKNIQKRLVQPNEVTPSRPARTNIPEGAVRGAHVRLQQPRPKVPKHKSNVQPGTVRNARQRLLQPNEVAPPRRIEPIVPRNAVNNARQRLLQPNEVIPPRPARTNIPEVAAKDAHARLQQPRPEAPKHKSNVQPGTVRNTRQRLLQPNEVVPPRRIEPIVPRNAVNNARQRLLQPRPEAPKHKPNVQSGTVRNARQRLVREAETNAQHEANRLRLRRAERNEIIRQREVRERPNHIAPRPAQPAPPLRAARPRAVREAEDNALREARARAARRDELRDVIREREARNRRVIDFAQGRDGVWRAPRQPARVNVVPAAAPRLGRVRRLINAIEEAAQNVWRRARAVVRPRVAPRRAVPAAPRAMARPRPRLPHPGVLGGLRDAELRPNPIPLPRPRRLNPAPVADAVEDPIIAPIPRPRVFPSLNPVLPPARALIPEEPEELEEEIIEEEANKDPIEDNEEYNYEEEDNDDTPGVAANPEEKEDKDEPSKPDSTKTDTDYSPSIAPAPPAEKSLGTRTKQPASKTLGATYTGFTPLVNDIEAWLQKTLPPKVTSMIISKNNQETKPEIRIFTPQNRTIDVQNQKRMLTQNYTQQDKPKATNAPAQLKDSKVDTTKDCFSNIWETIKSVGKKITNFVRPLMFWVH